MPRTILERKVGKTGRWKGPKGCKPASSLGRILTPDKGGCAPQQGGYKAGGKNPPSLRGARYKKICGGRKKNLGGGSPPPLSGEKKKRTLSRGGDPPGGCLYTRGGRKHTMWGRQRRTPPPETHVIPRGGGASLLRRGEREDSPAGG